MRSAHCMKWWLMTALSVLALLWAASAQAAAPASWKDTGFSIDTGGLHLRDVLKDFGKVYGVTVSTGMDDEVRMKGRFKADSGSEFLDRLGQSYKFNWFVYNGTLYIVPRDDNISIRLQVGEDAVQDAKSALLGLGLFDSRFGWGELPNEGIVMLSGPRRYVELARDILLPDEKKAALKGKQIMVFRLKYASATDRVINTRGHSETIPGVKTILGKLLFSSEGGEKVIDEHRSDFDAGSRKRSRTAKVEKGGAREVASSLFGASPDNADAASDSAGEDNKERPWKAKSSSEDSRPRIEANPSLNAIMIFDKVSKRAMYQALIDQLDIEPKQVEIEALIIDIDRSKLSELGVEWGFKSGNVNTTINGTKVDSQGSDLPIPGSTILISNVARFYARLKALEGTGDAHVLATPTVLTLDNVAAVLDLSQTAYVPLEGERVADLADVTAGTMLRVIPRIIHDDDRTRVHMEVDIEDGSLDESGTNVNATRTTISTQAIVNLQQTLMIGGYHSESVSKDNQQVPLLGDIPLFGNLFKSSADSQRSRERLFLITPRLVVDASAQAATETGRHDAAVHQSLHSVVPALNAGHTALTETAARVGGVSDLSVVDWSWLDKTGNRDMPVVADRSAPITERQPQSDLMLTSASYLEPAPLQASSQASSSNSVPAASPVLALRPSSVLAARPAPEAVQQSSSDHGMNPAAAVEQDKPAPVTVQPRTSRHKCARPKGMGLVPA